MKNQYRTKQINERMPGNKKANLYLNVPYGEKDIAKNKGAWWDNNKRKWYVPHGMDIHRFKRWWPNSMS